MFCSAIYFAITSSVTFPELQQKYPRAHRCRPQNCFFKCGYSPNKWCAVFPFSHCHLRRHRYKQMHMILGHVPLHDLHLVFRANIPDQIPDAGSHFPTQRGRRYFVIQTRCRWISKTVCAPLR
jgi:hypothetical protein